MNGLLLLGLVLNVKREDRSPELKTNNDKL